MSTQPQPAATASATPAAPNFTAHERWNRTMQLLAPVLLAVAIGLVIIGIGNAQQTTQAVATVAFITGAAVGIERVIEGFWNLLGSNIGVYWPMTSISKQVHELELELADAMGPFQSTLGTALTQAQATAGQLPAYLTSAQTDMDAMRRRFDDIRAHAPSNQRMQLLAAAASQSVNFLVTKYEAYLPQLRNGVALADTAIGGMQDFLATFKDNPGRRLLSLYLGALLGLVLAYLFKLDVFAAVNTGATAPAPLPTSAGLRVAFTGLLIGLGSNPTHEVIQVLQQYKQGRKSENTTKPALPSQRLTAKVEAAV